ncbi:bcl-2-like protein 1 [Hydractinia symbiolongicarpus]|uniref:bcl-2-like protein 1 n=1 Tax=Hydractinia symbiolongicarpus TaxID=13093 RepID=UPI00254C14F9|nr:bcl-2-like protein 1 [Hydractinia symbiolongicarpus]
MAGASAQEDDEYREVIKSFVGERLRRNGIFIPGYDTEENLGEPSLDIASTLRRVGDELEAVNSEFFGHMCEQLQITPNNAYPTFQGICDEIFVSGKNWGRIVAFLTFGSRFAVHCASRNDLGYDYVDRIVSWISKYMSLHLDYWMKQHGSWGGFVDFFQKSDGNTNGGSNQNGFIVSALAGLGIGALLMMTFK